MSSEPAIIFVGCTGKPLGPPHRQVIRKIIYEEMKKAQQNTETPPVDDSVEQMNEHTKERYMKAKCELDAARMLVRRAHGSLVLDLIDEAHEHERMALQNIKTPQGAGGDYETSYS